MMTGADIQALKAYVQARDTVQTLLHVYPRPWLSVKHVVPPLLLDRIHVSGVLTLKSYQTEADSTFGI